MSDLTIKEIEKLLDFNDDLLLAERVCGNDDRSNHLAGLGFAIRQLMNEQKWRPISEAPTDGTRILGCVAGEHSDQVEVIFNAKGTGWFNQSAELSMWNVFPPTHWRPLPSPPETSDE